MICYKRAAAEVAITIIVLLSITAQVVEGKGRRNVLLNSGWQFHTPIEVRSSQQFEHQQEQHQPQHHYLPPQPPIISGIHPSHHYFFPRTENYYHRMKPDAIVEIIVDPSEDLGTMVEHSSMTTQIHSQTEYRASCVKEPGCRWECEPRADDLPPDCDCVCFYTDAKWDNIP